MHGDVAIASSTLHFYFYFFPTAFCPSKMCLAGPVLNGLGFGLVMHTQSKLQAQNVHYRGPKCVRPRADKEKKKKRGASSIFVLPTTSICTYNVGICSPPELFSDQICCLNQQSYIFIYQKELYMLSAPNFPKKILHPTTTILILQFKTIKHATLIICSQINSPEFIDQA